MTLADRELEPDIPSDAQTMGNVQVLYGPEGVDVPDGTVLYLDQLLVDETGSVRIDGIADSLVHLVCPSGVDVVSGSVTPSAGMDAAVYSWDVGSVTVTSEAAVMISYLDG